MLYTRLFVRKRSVFITKVVFYRLSTFTVDAIIHSTSLLHKCTLHSLCLWNPILSLTLFSVKGVRYDCPAGELQWNVWNKSINSLCQLDHCTFCSPQIKFAPLFIFLSSHSDFHCIHVWCRGDQDIHHLLWHSHSTRCVCNRVGVYLLLGKEIE